MLSQDQLRLVWVALNMLGGGGGKLIVNDEKNTVVLQYYLARNLKFVRFLKSDKFQIQSFCCPGF